MHGQDKCTRFDCQRTATGEIQANYSHDEAGKSTVASKQHRALQLTVSQIKGANHIHAEESATVCRSRKS